MDERKFKIGDKVRILFKYPFTSSNFDEGNIGTIIFFSKLKKNSYAVSVNGEWMSFFEEDLELV